MELGRRNISLHNILKIAFAWQAHALLAGLPDRDDAAGHYAAATAMLDDLAGSLDDDPYAHLPHPRRPGLPCPVGQGRTPPTVQVDLR